MPACPPVDLSGMGATGKSSDLSDSPLMGGIAMSKSTTTEAFVPVVDQMMVDTYRAAEKSQKVRIRTLQAKLVQDHIRKGDLFGAMSAQATLDAFGASRPEPVAIDYVALVASRVATLRLAADLIESGKVTPDGVDVATVDLSGLADIAGTPNEELATKLATSRVSRRTGTDSHDTKAIIEHAFEQVDSGTFLSIAQIRSLGHESTCCDTYKGDGAIAAYMFPSGSPRDDIAGVQVVNMEAGRARGGVKV